MSGTKKQLGRILTTDAEIRALVKESRTFDPTYTLMVRATYDRRRDMIDVELSTGVALLVPRRSIVGFAKAAPDQLADLAIEPGNRLLWSETVDNGVEFEQLMVIAFGKEEIGFLGGRINGAKKSPARASASRLNGQKGGRPRKKTPA